MDCRALLDQLPGSLDGELPRPQRIRLALHLLLCAPCRRYRASYRATVRLARGLAEAELDPAEVEQLVEAMRALRS